MKIEIVNQQKIKRVNLKQLQKDLKKLLIFLNIPSKKFSVYLCDNVSIRELNKNYFKKSHPTDVISFPLSDGLEPGYLGEIVASVEEAVQTAERLGVNWRKELFLYIVHGLLHLIGYDDRKKGEREIMERKQKEIMEKLFIEWKLGAGESP